MKRYKINRAFQVNARYSKSGVKWEYGGKKTIEEAQELKDMFERTLEERRQNSLKVAYCLMIGLRITDTETGTVIYEKTI